MAQAVVIEVIGLDRLKANFKKSPEVVRHWINRAIKAGIFEIEAEAVDDNFQFKTPRALRTGLLQRSFKLGTRFADLQGEIGPTVFYAPKVHQNNPFMERIVRVSKGKIERHFNDAMENIAKDLS